MILLVLSFVRTVVPAIVGAVIAYLVSLGLTVDGEFEKALTAVLFAVFTGLYYLIVRVIEMKLPIVGVLLGYAKSPDSYSKGPGVDITKPSGSPEVTVNVQQDANAPFPDVYVNRLTDGPDHRI